LGAQDDPHTTHLETGFIFSIWSVRLAFSSKVLSTTDSDDGGLRFMRLSYLTTKA
jgi:hypothetical protein